MEKIELKDQASLELIAAAMKRGETFVILTEDSNFKPLGYDWHSAHVWIGAGALVLAFLDPEPTSKLTALTVGGILMVLAGGGIIFTILVTRSGYVSTVHFDADSGKYEWILSPK
jgi:hypothetical protein